MKTNILFIKTSSPLLFEQRVKLKEEFQIFADEADLNAKVIVMENGMEATLFDAELTNKISLQTEAIDRQTEAIKELIQEMKKVEISGNPF